MSEVNTSVSPTPQEEKPVIKPVVPYKDEAYTRSAELDARMRVSSSGFPMLVVTADAEDFNNAEGDLLSRFLRLISNPRYSVEARVTTQHQFSTDAENNKPPRRYVLMFGVVEKQP